ncbi:NlpC/P60 family protein [Shinella zoogloeoides]|uniref:NlpC/P60 family protein n=1 Tax=Shinella zoogloeoides TaxID=352475 RepID=UPI00273D06F2|nr:NlpC/P60 family protein [Shinella zoogloeoides]WLR91007.1 NlpC/P60 family protein [Shinella zoogloeoides]
MIGQISTDVAWGIIPILEEDKIFRIGEPIMWGGNVPKSDLIGREFLHGIHDCYSLIKDTFALGKEGLAAQGISDVWPYEPRLLPEVPRDDGWWELGKDLYVDGLKKNGFRIIQPHEARAGDGFLTKIRSDKLNHAGLLVTDDTIIHHLPMRASRREPAGLWGRQAEIWVRHEGLDA